MIVIEKSAPDLLRIDLQEIRRQSFGRWPDILVALDISPAALTKKNKPCPCCGGTDRFSFIDQGVGRFVCRSLDSMGGDGFALVMHWLSCDFKTALRAVAGALGLSAGVEINRVPALSATPTAPRRDNSAMIAKLWAEALPIRAGEPVARYLAHRGLDLSVFPAALRHHPGLDYWAEVDDRPAKICTYPAMLAQVISPNGEVVGLHRIYLTQEGRKAAPRHPVTGEALDAKKLLTARDGAMRGAAVRLYEPEAGKLAVAEGIETALAVRLGCGLPCWASVSAWGMKNIVLPESVDDVYVMADNDTSGTGQKAANALARRLLAEERRVRVAIPERAGTDWLDVLNAQQEREAA